MGLLYSNYETNNTLKFNACSGGIYKTYKESWFIKFHLDSAVADTLFKPYDNKIQVESSSSYYSIPKEPVVILQMIICGEMQVIAEVIKEEDFNKYFEKEEQED